MKNRHLGINGSGRAGGRWDWHARKKKKKITIIIIMTKMSMMTKTTRDDNPIAIESDDAITTMVHVYQFGVG
jgi:hypothetical protein